MSYPIRDRPQYRMRAGEFAVAVGMEMLEMSRRTGIAMRGLPMKLALLCEGASTNNLTNSPARGEIAASTRPPVPSEQSAYSDVDCYSFMASALFSAGWAQNVDRQSFTGLDVELQRNDVIDALACPPGMCTATDSRWCACYRTPGRESPASADWSSDTEVDARADWALWLKLYDSLSAYDPVVRIVFTLRNVGGTLCTEERREYDRPRLPDFVRVKQDFQLDEGLGLRHIEPCDWHQRLPGDVKMLVIEHLLRSRPWRPEELPEVAHKVYQLAPWGVGATPLQTATVDCGNVPDAARLLHTRDERWYLTSRAGRLLVDVCLDYSPGWRLNQELSRHPQWTPDWPFVLDGMYVNAIWQLLTDWDAIPAPPGGRTIVLNITFADGSLEYVPLFRELECELEHDDLYYDGLRRPPRDVLFRALAVFLLDPIVAYARAFTGGTTVELRIGPESSSGEMELLSGGWMSALERCLRASLLQGQTAAP